MTGEERRSLILKDIKASGQPLSGKCLAQKYSVSRQVIVQDIALLKIKNPGICSTARGYMLLEDKNAQNSQQEQAADAGGVTAVFKVMHSDEETEAELNAIVDMGGKVIDVFVNHSVYGRMTAPLKVSCRRHVKTFIEEMRQGKASPLKNLTDDVHFHTVEADSQETIELIRAELDRLGFLVE